MKSLPEDHDATLFDHEVTKNDMHGQNDECHNPAMPKTMDLINSFCSPNPSCKI